jgi:hypothetical protein
MFVEKLKAALTGFAVYRELLLAFDCLRKKRAAKRTPRNEHELKKGIDKHLIRPTVCCLALERLGITEVDSEHSDNCKYQECNPSPERTTLAWAPLNGHKHTNSK